MPRRMRIAFFGSSLVSSYWNSAATYYRGIVHSLSRRGHHVTFFEPKAFGRQQHRDIDDPPWARVVAYSARCRDDVLATLEQARGADVVVKASGIGVYDALLEREVLNLRSPTTCVVFWDVDAPATLERLAADTDDPLRTLVPSYDVVLTCGGGQRAVMGYRMLGARECVPIYNALDPQTHYPVHPAPRFEGDLGLLCNRLSDCDERVDRFFLQAARRLSQHRFLLGGVHCDTALPRNVVPFGQVSARDQNAFHCSVRMVLNVNRDAMARFGWSPPDRVFEAAGAGGCVIVDRWEGIEDFLEPGSEVLVADDTDDVLRHLRNVTPARARGIGGRARRRLLRQHTYAQRALQVERVLGAQALPARTGAVA